MHVHGSVVLIQCISLSVALQRMVAMMMSKVVVVVVVVIMGTVVLALMHNPHTHTHCL